MYGTPGPGHAAHQRVLNTSWPADATKLRDRPERIAVTARVEFATDGVTTLDGWAVRWDPSHVCVALSDPRLQVRYVWLRPADIHRR